MLDKVKLVVAALCVAAGIAAFYKWPQHAQVLRVLYVAGGLLVGAGIALWTAPGQAFKEFAQLAWAETKKVVWPSRKETIQTTAAVFAFVFVMALFLWGVDKTLEFALYDLLLGWKKS
jgi:preprotein translocase subunit SecE